MFNKIFNLSWLGKNKKVEELEKKVEKLLKPYKTILYSNGILTVILHSSEVLSAVYDKAEIDKVMNAYTRYEIESLMFPKKVEIKEISYNFDEEESEAEKKFEENSEEVLELLNDERFELRKNKHYYRDTNIPITGLILNSLLEAKRNNNLEAFESLVKFWLWSLLNPIKASREDLFKFIKKNDIKLTTNGLLVCYRNIVNVKNSNATNKDHALVEYISDRYFHIKKNKKSPTKYAIWKSDALIENNLLCLSIDKKADGDFKLIGNLKELYFGLKEETEITYTDNHTHTKVIKIGDIYREDEDKIDLNNKVECSEGLSK